MSVVSNKKSSTRRKKLLALPVITNDADVAHMRVPEALSVIVSTGVQGVVSPASRAEPRAKWSPATDIVHSKTGVAIGSDKAQAPNCRVGERRRQAYVPPDPNGVLARAKGKNVVTCDHPHSNSREAVAPLRAPSSQIVALFLRGCCGAGERRPC